MIPIVQVVREMSIEEQVEYGLCTRDLMLEQGEHVYRLTAGATDTVQVFKQGTILFVLTVNYKLDYVALDWYQGNECEPIDSLFLRGDYAVREFAGSGWRALSQVELARRLSRLFA